MRNLRKLFQLSRPELWILIQATVLLSAIHLALKFVTVKRLQRLAERTLPRAKVLSLPPDEIARMVRLSAERGAYEAKCLEQSLVLSWLLRRRGVDARVVFGARKQDTQMEAHAWVEVDGVAINEEHGFHRDFAPFEGLAASN